MPNLFFVHTPMQLLVSQQIIRQEKLKNNVMLYGYVDDNAHFLNIYDITIIDTQWDDTVLMPQVSSWADMSRKHLIRDCKKIVDNYKYIIGVIEKYQIDTVFLGDMANSCYQLASMCFHRLNLKVCFYEEGTSHYRNNIGVKKHRGIINYAFGALIDMFFYKPFLKVSYGRIVYSRGIDYSDIPMDARYSLVPFYHEPFDKLIIYQPLISEKLRIALQNEMCQSTDNCILLLTSPFYINGIDDNPLPYIKTIVDYAKSLENNEMLHIKFHPRETQLVRGEILSQLEGSGVKYIQLGKEHTIPVEYYLQFLHYDKIVMFLCSTSFYNGYLFPKTQFVSILKEYYDNCKAIGSVEAKYLEPLLDKIPKE